MGVLAFDKTLTYARLETACLLLRAGLPYLATNPDKVCPTEHGYIPDCGGMAALLREATGRSPMFIGKPNAEMASMGMAKLDAVPETTAMVGDRLYTDMRMAHHAGAHHRDVAFRELAHEIMGLRGARDARRAASVHSL